MHLAGDAPMNDAQLLIGVASGNNQIMVRHLAELHQSELTIVQKAELPAPRPIRSSVQAKKDDPVYRAREAERKRRERRKRRRLGEATR